MKHDFNSKQLFASVTFGLMVMTGTYNAIVINSESSIKSTDSRFAKRLDEVYGTVSSNRGAASIKWQKLSVQQAAVERVEQYQPANFEQQQQAQVASAPSSSEAVTEAAVKEDLNLNLTAVANLKKWQNGLTNTQFSGNLVTNQGMIEKLNISLPNNGGFDVSFSEMTGNVFEYDYEGGVYSGMMYQEGQNSYVVKLTNGPLEGTTLTFAGEPSLEEQMQLEETQRTLAEAAEISAADRGDAIAEVPVENPENDLAIQAEMQAAQNPDAPAYDQEQNPEAPIEQAQVDQEQNQTM